MSSLRITISNRYRALQGPATETRRMLRQLEASALFPIAGGELSIAFVSDRIIAKVHADFMNDPTPTDVITFPADAAMDFAGEIIVSVDHALAHAKAAGDAFNQELALYILHGWLHLAGYDDRTDKQRQQMRFAEQQALSVVADVVPNYLLR